MLCTYAVIGGSPIIHLTYTPIRASTKWEQSLMLRTCRGSSSPGSTPSSRLAPQKLSTRPIYQSYCPNCVLEPFGPNSRSSRMQGMDSDLCYQTKASFVVYDPIDYLFAPVPVHVPCRLSPTAQFEYCRKGGNLCRINISL